MLKYASDMPVIAAMKTQNVATCENLFMSDVKFPHVSTQAPLFKADTKGRIKKSPPIHKETAIR
jgi:hypothetical protein